MKKKVEILESELREAYEFNGQPPEYKNRRTAFFRVWKDKDRADLHYNEEGNFYPKGEGPMAEIHPAQIVEESKGWSYPALSETRELVADEHPDIDKDSEEYREKVSEWHKEAEDIAWESCNFKNDIELSEHPELDTLEIEIVSEKQEKVRELQENTNLSSREAELYFLTEIEGMTVSDAAEEMGIEYGNASKKRSRIREKIKKAEKTAELSI